MPLIKVSAFKLGGILCVVLLAIPARGQGRRSNAATTAAEQSSKPSNAGASTSRIQIVYPPANINTSGGCQGRITTVTILATAENLHGPLITNGVLVDKDSGGKLPTSAFQLLEPSGKGTGCKNGYVEVTKNTAIPPSQLVTLYIKLRDAWVRPGNYSGNLWVAAAEDTAGQSMSLNVSVRPAYSWGLGILFIALGTGLSWLATVKVVRQRQLAGNEILIARLGELLNELQRTLDSVGAAGAPAPTHTLDHLSQIREQKLRELLTDKQLSVIAGVTVPPVGAVSVLDEIEGVNRVTRQGFVWLLDLWSRNPGAHTQLEPFFGQMDTLGSMPRALTEVDQGIKNIRAAAQSAATGAKVVEEKVASLPQESAEVHRILAATNWLDFASSLTVVALGVYVLIWKNPGFGSIGDLLIAFFWGLGLKLGTDAARLGPSDVRTAYGIKIPSPP